MSCLPLMPLSSCWQTIFASGWIVDAVCCRRITVSPFVVAFLQVGYDDDIDRSEVKVMGLPLRRIA